MVTNSTGSRKWLISYSFADMKRRKVLTDLCLFRRSLALSICIGLLAVKFGSHLP